MEIFVKADKDWRSSDLKLKFRLQTELIICFKHNYC